MFTMMLFALAVTAQDLTHVRPLEPQLRAVMDEGLSRSGTFRRLVATLDQSNVIVYIAPKIGRPDLGGYLAHAIVAQGGFRYLRIAIDMQGPANRLIPVLAHELQHAIEVAETPEAIDANGLEQVFIQRAAPSGCGRACHDTQMARDVEFTVGKELAATFKRTASSTHQRDDAVVVALKRRSADCSRPSKPRMGSSLWNLGNAVRACEPTEALDASQWSQSIHSNCDQPIEVKSRRGRDGLARARAAASDCDAQ
jgi:hypothetical protein